MTRFTAIYRTAAAYACHDFTAATPEDALAEARALLAADPAALAFLPYDGPQPVEEITVVADTADDLAVWSSAEFALAAAAAELRDALTEALAALNTAPRFRVPGLARDSYQIAARCAAALARTTGG